MWVVSVLVTGGAGFIGSHLCDAFLAQGEEVSVIDDLSTGSASRLDDRVTLYKETVLDAPEIIALVDRIQPTLICHLAAQVDVRRSVAFPNEDANVNVVGTINILEAARKVDARVVYCSTGGAIYGNRASVPSPESTPPKSESPYGIAKYCAEQYIGLYNRLYGVEHAILRFANVYGPRQNPSGESGVIPIFCSHTLEGRSLTIYGDGKQTRDYVYVSDVVTAILSVAKRVGRGIWNIGTGSEVSVLDLVEVIYLATGRRSELQYAPLRSGELMRSALSPKLAERELGWRATTSLASGVEAVYRWIETGACDRAIP